MPRQPPGGPPRSVAPSAAAARVRDIATMPRQPGPGAPRDAAPCSRSLQATRKLGLDVHPRVLISHPPPPRVTSSPVSASGAGPGGGGGRQPKRLLATRKLGLVAHPRGSSAAVSPPRSCSLSQACILRVCCRPRTPPRPLYSLHVSLSAFFGSFAPNDGLVVHEPPSPPGRRQHSGGSSSGGRQSQGDAPANQPNNAPPLALRPP